MESPGWWNALVATHCAEAIIAHLLSLPTVVNMAAQHSGGSGRSVVPHSTFIACPVSATVTRAVVRVSRIVQTGYNLRIGNSLEVTAQTVSSTAFDGGTLQGQYERTMRGSSKQSITSTSHIARRIRHAYHFCARDIIDRRVC